MSQPVLNNWYTINSDWEIFKNTACHVLLKTAAVVAAVAAVALLSTAAVLTFLQVPATPLFIAVAVGALLSFPIIEGARRSWRLGEKYLSSELQERGVEQRRQAFAKELLESSKSLSEVKNISPDFIKIFPSTQKAEEAWLKMFARLTYYRELAVEEMGKYQTTLERLKESPPETASEYYLANQNLEQRIGRAVLKTFLFYEILRSPFTELSSIEELGTFRLKPNGLREIEQIHQHNDDYFFCHKEGSAPIQLDEIKQVVADFATEGPSLLATDLQSRLFT